MRIKKITLQNYRNYDYLTMEFTQNLNVFLGSNAQGKTNLIEAIYYAAMGASHRSNQDFDLIQWDQPEARATLFFERMSVENELTFAFRRDKRREIYYNGQKIRPRDLVGAMNVVLFSPEDLFLIKGAPAGRRKFLDNEISQATPAYYQKLMRYNRAVIQRNTLLKKIRERKASKASLDAWDFQVANLAASIVSHRLTSIKKLTMLANLMHRKLSSNKENLEIHYILDERENFIPEDAVLWYNKRLNEVREQDILRGFTSVGPHRDDITLKINQINLRTFGSQGQQRTGILALKLAELEFMKSETGEYPILLLDDVMSELDQNRRCQLLLFIKERIQTFITATDRSYFPNQQVGKFYKVTMGRIVE